MVGPPSEAKGKAVVLGMAASAGAAIVAAAGASGGGGGGAEATPEESPPQADRLNAIAIADAIASVRCSVMVMLLLLSSTRLFWTFTFDNY